MQQKHLLLVLPWQGVEQNPANTYHTATSRVSYSYGYFLVVNMHYVAPLNVFHVQ